MSEIETIRNFDLGIIGQSESEDIPNNAFTWAKDIDPITTEGRVRGIESLGSDITVGDKARVSDFIENAGTYDLILHNSEDDKIQAVVDFYGTNKKTLDLVISSIGDSSILINNQEAHVGIGNANPKWVGHIPIGQFSKDRSWTVTNATNASPIVITASGHTAKNGNLIKISGVLGNTAANGIFIIASSNMAAGTFQLSGSTGNGAYTSGGTAEEYLSIENDNLDNYTTAAVTDGTFIIDSATATIGSAPKYFLTGMKYRWAMSYIYDGYQESPLAKTDGVPRNYPYTDIINTVVGALVADTEYYTINIKATGGDDNTIAFNKRITGVNLYRAEEDSTGILTSYKLIAYIDINDSNWTAALGDMGINVIDYGLKTVIGTDEISTGSPSYETQTGINQAVSNIYMRHSLSAKGEGYSFYGLCYKDDLPDASKYIFRSKYLRPSIIDWTNTQDFLIMHRPITALTYYEGRLYAFDLNNTYRINPINFVIEDVFEGIGASGQRSVCITPYGMYIANTNGAYRFDGQTFQEISLAIKTSTTTTSVQTPNEINWQMFDLTYIPDIIVTYSAEKSSILFTNTILISATYYVVSLVWNVLKKRWDYWELDTASNSSGFIIGKDGELYLSTTTTTKQMFAGARKAFSFIAKMFTGGDPSQTKDWNMLKWDGVDLTVRYSTNGSDPFAGTIVTSGTYINTYSTSLRLCVTASSTTAYLDSISALYRNMIGLR